MNKQKSQLVNNLIIRQVITYSRFLIKLIVMNNFPHQIVYREIEREVSTFQNPLLLQNNGAAHGLSSGLMTPNYSQFHRNIPGGAASQQSTVVVDKRMVFQTHSPNHNMLSSAMGTPSGGNQQLNEDDIMPLLNKLLAQKSTKQLQVHHDFSRNSGPSQFPSNLTINNNPQAISINTFETNHQLQPTRELLKPRQSAVIINQQFTQNNTTNFPATTPQNMDPFKLQAAQNTEGTLNDPSNAARVRKSLNSSMQDANEILSKKPQENTVKSKFKYNNNISGMQTLNERCGGANFVNGRSQISPFQANQSSAIAFQQPFVQQQQYQQVTNLQGEQQRQQQSLQKQFQSGTNTPHNRHMAPFAENSLSIQSLKDQSAGITSTNYMSANFPGEGRYRPQQSNYGDFQKLSQMLPPRSNKQFNLAKNNNLTQQLQLSAMVGGGAKTLNNISGTSTPMNKSFQNNIFNQTENTKKNVNLLSIDHNDKFSIDKGVNAEQQQIQQNQYEQKSIQRQNITQKGTAPLQLSKFAGASRTVTQQNLHLPSINNTINHIENNHAQNTQLHGNSQPVIKQLGNLQYSQSQKNGLSLLNQINNSSPLSNMGQLPQQLAAAPNSRNVGLIGMNLLPGAGYLAPSNLLMNNAQSSSNVENLKMQQMKMHELLAPTQGQLIQNQTNALGASQELASQISRMQRELHGGLPLVSNVIISQSVDDLRGISKPLQKDNNMKGSPSPTGSTYNIFENKVNNTSPLGQAKSGVSPNAMSGLLQKQSYNKDILQNQSLKYYQSANPFQTLNTPVNNDNELPLLRGFLGDKAKYPILQVMNQPTPKMHQSLSQQQLIKIMRPKAQQPQQQQMFPVSPTKRISKNAINFTNQTNPSLGLVLQPQNQIPIIQPQPIIYRDSEQIELLKQILQAVSAKPKSDIANHTANFGLVSTTSLEQFKYTQPVTRKSKDEISQTPTPQEDTEKMKDDCVNLQKDGQKTNKHDITTQTLLFETEDNNQRDVNTRRGRKVSNSIFSTTMPGTLSLSIDDASPILQQESSSPQKISISKTRLKGAAGGEGQRSIKDIQSNNAQKSSNQIDDVDRILQQLDQGSRLQTPSNVDVRSKFDNKTSKSNQVEQENKIYDDEMDDKQRSRNVEKPGHIKQLSRDSVNMRRNALIPGEELKIPIASKKEQQSSDNRKSQVRKSENIKKLGFNEIMFDALAAEPQKQNQRKSSKKVRKSKNQEQFSESTLNELSQINFNNYGHKEDNERKINSNNKHKHTKSAAIDQNKVNKSNLKEESIDVTPQTKKSKNKESEMRKKRIESEFIEEDSGNIFLPLKDPNIQSIKIEKAAPKKKMESASAVSYSQLLQDKNQNNQLEVKTYESLSSKKTKQFSKVVGRNSKTGTPKSTISPLSRVDKPKNLEIPRSVISRKSRKLSNNIEDLDSAENNPSTDQSVSSAEDPSILNKPLSSNKSQSVPKLQLAQNSNFGEKDQKTMRPMFRQPTASVDYQALRTGTTSIQTGRRRSTVLILKNDISDLQNQLVQFSQNFNPQTGHINMLQTGTGFNQPQRQGTMISVSAAINQQVVNKSITRSGTGVTNIPTHKARNSQSKMLMVQNLVSKIKKKELPQLPSKIEPEPVPEESLDDESTVKDPNEQANPELEKKDPQEPNLEEDTSFKQILEPFNKMAKDQPNAPKGKRRFIDYMLTSAKNEIKLTSMSLASQGQGKGKRKSKINISIARPSVKYM